MIEFLLYIHICIYIFAHFQRDEIYKSVKAANNFYYLYKYIFFKLLIRLTRRGYIKNNIACYTFVYTIVFI